MARQTTTSKAGGRTAKEPGKQSTKEILLELGIQIMLEKGYNNTGIQEVLEKAGVPKGSFYYYFESKEDFGLQIIDHFDQNVSERLRICMEDPERTPLERLKKYCEDGKQMLEAQYCRRGCLIGNLSQEMADQSDSFRAKLEEVLTKWRNRFAHCIQEGQKQGEIPARFDHVQLAELFLSGWEGAIMRAKTTKNAQSLQIFIDIMFNQVLRSDV
jgi:TetR/AcrR family transcriptional regulator, transcriptional repressor for nem operon